MKVISSSWHMLGFPGMFLTNSTSFFLSSPGAPIVTGIVFGFSWSILSISISTSLYLESFFKFFQSNVSISWDRYIDQEVYFILKIFPYNTWLVGIYFLGIVYGKFPQDRNNFGLCRTMGYLYWFICQKAYQLFM